MTKDEIMRLAAAAAHEANRAYCGALGDFSQPSWDDAPAWQKNSALNGVRLIEANPDTSPSASHDGWLEEKRKDGWVYGEIKDAEKKEHPCFVSYDKLPASQKAKDAIFGAIVRGVLAHYDND